jgi:hypothetical protein
MVIAGQNNCTPGIFIIKLNILYRKFLKYFVHFTCYIPHWLHLKINTLNYNNYNLVLIFYLKMLLLFLT